PFRQLLKVEQGIVRPLNGADQLVEFDLSCLAVAVLRVLNDEHHQEGDDRRTGVDDQLPTVGVIEQRAGQGPADYDGAGENEGLRSAGGTCRPIGEASEMGLIFHEFSPRLEDWIMLFMVVERFKDQNLKAVYRRFQEQGRMTPEGLAFV